jgi:cysteine desulfurase
MTDSVYLDNAATTPLDSRVLDAMLPYFGRRGNPSSLHSLGAAAQEAIEEAREDVASLINAAPEEIIFTGGGTEADNLGVLGLARSASSKRHVVISAVEHAAVRATARHLESTGYELTVLGVDETGTMDPDELAAALRPDTALAAVVWANNEVGTVQPVTEIARVCAANDVPFHTDAAQAAGRIPIDVQRVPASTVALSSHKIYGPQGVGALYVRGGLDLEPVIFGGGQERGLRSGTQDAAGIVGFGVAARLAAEEYEERSRHEEALRDALISGAAGIPGVRLNGHPENRLPNNVHLTVEGVEAEGLVLFCDAQGYAIGSGSACASGGHKASPVLTAMGQSEREAFSAVRITVGKENTMQEVEGFLKTFEGAVEQLRQLSPLYAN